MPDEGGVRVARPLWQELTIQVLAAIIAGLVLLYLTRRGR
jgi:hypothetical protein